MYVFICVFCKIKKENEYIEVNLPHHGLQGIEYNLDDLGIKNYNLTEEKLKYEGYMFTYE